MVKTGRAGSSTGMPSQTKWISSGAGALTPCLVLLVLLAVVCSSAGLAKDMDWDHALAKGYDQLGKGNTEDAIKFFQDKVRKYPTSAQCHTGLGKSLKRLHKISEAKDEFRKATEVDPGFADAFYELGAVLEDDKDWQGAATAFEKFLELKPDSGQRKTVSDRITYCRGQQQ